jgi:GNAT superfamily N-acetyltransferase
MAEAPHLAMLVFGWVEDVYVDAEHRGQGAGLMLMAFA